MVIFSSYVQLPEGIVPKETTWFQLHHGLGTFKHIHEVRSEQTSHENYIYIANLSIVIGKQIKIVQKVDKQMSSNDQ